MKNAVGLHPIPPASMTYHDVHETGLPFYPHYGDLTDGSNLNLPVQEIDPPDANRVKMVSHVVGAPIKASTSGSPIPVRHQGIDVA